MEQQARRTANVIDTASDTKNSPVVFVGTYTEPQRSDGIYAYRMDSSSGRLTFETVLQGIVNPAFLAIHPRQGFLYAVSEVAGFAGRAGGGVSALSIGSPSCELTLMNDRPSCGEHPCYVSVEQTGWFALAANYTSGSVAMFPIQTDGRLGPASDVIQHSGSSVHPERQAGPHAHCIVPDPTNRFAIAADLGLDKLLIYRMDLDGGKLLPHAEVDVHPGAGPRHLTFHPNGRYAYLINELDATLTGYRYHAEAGTFEELQTVPALPGDFTGENLCADVHVSPDGKYLYGSNRGHDSLVCFLIDENSGRLTYLNHTSTGGRVPRNFAISPDGAFLLAANQETNNIVTFKIDPGTGKLLETGHEVEVPMPVCLKFASI
jgi:6-phosphogluconolactonase